MTTRWNPMLRDADLDNWEYTPKSSCCVAFTGRMGAGFPGEPNRTHPISIVPRQNDPTTPATLYGEAVLFTVAGNTVRTTAGGDTNNVAPGVTLAGVVVRPFPIQAPSSPQPFGGTGTQQTPFGDAGLPPAGLPIDVMTSGFILVRVNGSPVLGGPVFVWVGATAAPHVHGTFEAASGTTNTLLVANAYFNGPPDLNGNVEIAINP